MFEGAHKDARKRPRFALHGSSSGFRLSFAYYWQRFGTLSDEFCFTERKLCVENWFLNPDEQTRHKHGQLTYLALNRMSIWLVWLMFAWIRSEIIRIELIVVSLSDNLCAQRGEVSQRETPPWSELSMPICRWDVQRASPLNLSAEIAIQLGWQEFSLCMISKFS